MKSFIRTVDEGVDALTRYMAKHPAQRDVVSQYGIGGGTAVAGTVALTRLLQYGLKTFGWDAAATGIGTAMGTAFLLAVGGAFQFKMASLGSELGHKIGEGLLHLFGRETPAAAAPLSPMSAHSEAAPIVVHGDLHVHNEKATAADAEALVALIRRGVRTTGASTGGPGPESMATHGHPLSGR
jgi:hypothetical protein